MTDIQVTTTRVGDAWTCQVTLTDPDGSQTRHEVGVEAPDLARLAPNADDPTDLVRRSFTFLLARESKSSILRAFDLPVIGRYFPDYEREIRR